MSRRRAQPANPRSRRRNWIFLTRTHGQVTSVDRRWPGVPRHLRRRLRRGNPARNGGAVCRSPEGCAQIVAGSAELLLRFERSFENAFGKLAPIIRALACLQLFRKYFFRSGSADCGHCFHLEFIWNLKLFARALVIESFHPMHHQPLVEALQREVLPRCPSVIGMRNRRLVIVIEKLSRNEHDQNGSVLCPGFVRIDEQIEERLPMFRATTRVERAPLLSVERRWSPPRGFKKSHQFRFRNFFARHRARRPTIDEKWFDLMVCLTDFATSNHVRRHDSRQRIL